VKLAIEEKKYADEAWFEEIGEKIKSIVDEAVKFSEESPWPDPSELYNDVYMQSDYPYIRD
jgi:pyruvate dehydrogenase E1 component alpha subunit